MSDHGLQLPPPAARNTLPDNGNEALLQDALDTLNVDGGSWLLGRWVFWNQMTANGLLFHDALRAAVDAASPLNDEAAADKRFENLLVFLFPPRDDTTTTRGLVRTALGAFGSRRKPTAGNAGTN